jgi:endonuclease/exonuclease/phosphatase family metal-dependent hydrolase
MKALCFSALMLLYACPRGTPARHQAISLKIMSYNIHYGVGIDSVIDLGRITGMHSIFGASVEKEPPNLYHLLGIPMPASRLSYGDAILSKYPFDHVGNLSIPSASSSRYEAMCVDVDLTGKYGSRTVVRFIATHFDYLETIGSRAARLASDHRPILMTLELIDEEK